MSVPELAWSLTGSGRPAIVQGPAWGPPSDYLRATLVPLLDGLRVVTYDPRNVGASERVDAEDAQATRNLVDDLERLRETVGFDEPFVLLGHSHGGVVAMAYAVEHLERVAALVLLNTGLDEPGPGPETEAILEDLADDPRRRELVARHRADPSRPREFADEREMARWARELLPLYFYDADAWKRFGRELVGAPAPSIEAYRRTPRRPEPWIEKGLPRVRVPTLVVTGSHDVATPPSAARRIASLLPEATLAVLDRTGHHPWAERPEAFRELIEDFLGL